MGYYKLNTDGTIQSRSNKADDTWLPLSDLETKEDGSYYKYYNQDGTADIARIDKEVADLAKAEAEKLRDEAMLTGADYNSYQISFTKDDGDGMLQVKAGFELGLTETNIHFKNGTVLPMMATDFPVFASWFVSKRNEFFL